jgi:hypothetical protein
VWFQPTEGMALGIKDRRRLASASASSLLPLHNMLRVHYKTPLTSIRALRKHWRSESCLHEISHNFPRFAPHH